MKNLLLILLITLGFNQPDLKAQCPPNAFAFLSVYPVCPQGCGVLLKDWPEGVVVNIYGGNPLVVITSGIIPGTYGGPNIGNAFVCVPCGVPLIFASAIPGATNGCVIITLGVVPVKLTNFSVSSSANNSCVLKWTSSNEPGSTKYTVQRSSDSWNYTDVTTFTGNGNNSNAYTYTDRTVDQGTFYYRIKITDVEDKVTYSETALVKNQQNLGASIYPNPSVGDFKITVPSQFLPASVVIYDAVGKAVYSTTTMQPTLALNQHLSKGVYAVRITGKNNSSITQSLMIK